MIRILESIANTIVLVFGLIIHTIQSLVTLIIQIPTYVTWLLSAITFMPVLVMPFIIASISLLVILFVVGRGH